MNGDPVPTHATELRNHWWWRPGWGPGREFYTWHLTFDGQDELHHLVMTYQEALKDVAGLDLIPLRWLHLTTQGIGFTDEVRAEDIDAIAAAASVLLAKLPPIELICHRPLARPEALALPPFPRQAVVAIRNTLQEAIGTVWQDVPETGKKFDPHLSIAYVNANGPAAAAVDALDSVQPDPAQVTVRETSLIVLRRDGHLYRWNTFAKAPFRG